MKDLSSKKIRRKFAAAAKTYDEAAVLQREVADRLIERFQYIKKIPDVVLDVGCGTGYCTRALAKLYPDAFVTGFDIAVPMLSRAKEQGSSSLEYLSADAHVIPFKDKSVDFIVSNLALQWCDQTIVFNEFARILKPEGVVMFTTFGPGTLTELREAWSQVDDFQHVHHFADMHNLGDELLKCRLAEPVMDNETITLTYKNVGDMMKDLREIGANNAVEQQFKGLTGKDRFSRFKEAYKNMALEMDFEGRIPASYEIIYGQAWGPIKSSPEQVVHKKIIPVKTQYKPG